MGVCFSKKKIMPMWFILDEPTYGRPPSRQGPYSHETFIKLLAEKRIEQSQLIWTNEKIFPDSTKPKSSRYIRLNKWLHIHEFPDPTVRKLNLEAKKMMDNMEMHNHISLKPIPSTPAPDEIPPIPRAHQQQQQQNDVNVTDSVPKIFPATNKVYYDPSNPTPPPPSQ